MAETKHITPAMVHDAMRDWEALEVLQRDKNNTFIKLVAAEHASVASAHCPRSLSLNILFAVIFAREQNTQGGVPAR